MKSFLRGLLVLLIGAAGGYYLGIQYPDLKEKIPFLKSEQVEQTEEPEDVLPMEQPKDSTEVETDSI